jgi:hypothetical protein
VPRLVGLRIFRARLRVANHVVDSLLKHSGENGLFLRPTLDQDPAKRTHGVMWLPTETTLQHALQTASQCPQALGLVHHRGLGIRVPASALTAAYQTYFSQPPPPRALFYEISGVPVTGSAPALERLLAEDLHWEAKVTYTSKRTGKLLFKVKATSLLPRHISSFTWATRT